MFIISLERGVVNLLNKTSMGIVPVMGEDVTTNFAQYGTNSKRTKNRGNKVQFFYERIDD